MNIKKVVPKIILGLALFVSLNLNQAFAAQTTNQLNKVNFKKISTNVEEQLRDSLLNNFSNKESKNALKNLSKNAIGYTEVDVYKRTIRDNVTGEIIKDPNFYTSDEMEKIENEQNSNSGIIQPRSFPTTKENSWIRLKMEVYKLSSGKYDFYVFYNWKTKPYFTMNDVIGLGHDSNMYFDNATANSFHQQTIVNPTTLVETFSTQSYKSTSLSNCKTTLTGVAFKFKLPTSPDTWPTFYEGYINVKGGFTGSTVTNSFFKTFPFSFSYTKISYIKFFIIFSLDFV